MGLDVGARRIGVAVSTGVGTMATPLCTVDRGPKGKLDGSAMVRIERLAEEYEVTRFIVGEPKNMDGTLGPAAERSRKFAEAISARCGLPYESWDERLSTVEAEARLLDAGVDGRRRKALVDQVAAVIILEDWLAAQGL